MYEKSRCSAPNTKENGSFLHRKKSYILMKDLEKCLTGLCFDRMNYHPNTQRTDWIL
jgi:hypothetical protein